MKKVGVVILTVKLTNKNVQLNQRNQYRDTDTDPKQYWKLIKSLKEDSESDSTNSVEPEQWFQYFTELNQKPSSIESKLNYINSKVIDMENMKIFCELNFLISSKEISDGISKLKVARPLVWMVY